MVGQGRVAVQCCRNAAALPAVRCIVLHACPRVATYALPHGMVSCRECWAQDPQQRPDFSGIVARLGVMLGAPAPGMPPQHGSGGRSLE